MAGSKHQVNVNSNGTASTMKPFLHRKTSDDQMSVCAATVNQEKVATLSPDEDMPMNIPPCCNIVWEISFAVFQQK